MEHRHLDRSGLRVFRVTVGAMAFGGLGQVRVVGQTDPEGARRRVNRGLDALRRLGTDHIDLYHVHDCDGPTPLEETPTAREHLVRSGEVRYVGCWHFGGWQVMNAPAIADRPGLPRFVGQRVCPSVQAWSAEYEIVPSVLDHGLGPLDTIDVLVEVAQEQRVSPARVAPAWLLARSGITRVIVGRRTHEQLSAGAGVR